MLYSKCFWLKFVPSSLVYLVSWYRLKKNQIAYFGTKWTETLGTKYFLPLGQYFNPLTTCPFLSLFLTSVICTFDCKMCSCFSVDSRDSSPNMRSSSTLPVPQPSSAPPTPTRLAGANSDMEEEERGDLIQFYNNIYIRRVKAFALKYSTSSTESGVSCQFQYWEFSFNENLVEYQCE